MKAIRGRWIGMVAASRRDEPASRFEPGGRGSSSTAGPRIPIARLVRDPRGQHRRPGARPGRRGPGLADVPQSRLVSARGRVPLSAARGGGDPELRPAGRRPRAARPVAAQGRGPADLRGDRPHQARPGPARIHGPRALSHQRLSRSRPAPIARSRCATPSSASAIATSSSFPIRSAPRSSPPSRSSG